MKECDRVCDEMMDYLRGIMDKQRATATYKHLNTCGVCADKIKDFYFMVKLIKFLNLVNFKAPEGHRQAVMKMVEAQIYAYPVFGRSPLLADLV